MAKISQTEACNSFFNYGFICISILAGYRTFQINSYNLIRADIEAIQNEEVFVSTTKSLHLKLSNPIYIKPSFPMKLQNVCWCCLWISQSRQCKIWKLSVTFDELSSKTVSWISSLTIIRGDFNARSSSWWKQNKSTAEGTHLEALTSFHNFHQLISETTHCYLILIPVLI